MAVSAGEVTELLRAAQRGDKQAEARLLPLIYPELRRLARRQMRRERSDHTLQPTALVHEAYLRLTLQHDRTWRCRAHFLAIAAHLMRQVLIDYARARLREKRGGGEVTTWLDDQLADVNLPSGPDYHGSIQPRRGERPLLRLLGCGSEQDLSGSGEFSRFTSSQPSTREVGSSVVLPGHAHRRRGQR